LPVFVSILPQAGFVERIGGGAVAVEVLVGDGQSPHTFEPSPQQMARLSRARAYFAIGIPVEEGVLRKIRPTHPDLLVVATHQGVPLRYAQDGHHGDHRNDSGGRSPDPHIWLSPRLVKIQARHIRDALARLDPGRRSFYTANLQAFEAELDRLDARIASALAPVRGRKMYVFHPAFGYFADAYGLTQVPIEIEGKEPGPRKLAQLIRSARRDGVKVLFVQPQFSSKSAAALAKAVGGVVVAMDPLARDYVSNMERLAAAVEEGLRR
jgi:zinc transport system substrate-binding protein